LVVLPSFLMSLDKRIRARDFSESIIEDIEDEDQPETEEK